MSKFYCDRKFIISIIILFLNLMFYGCYSQREVTTEMEQPIKIYKIEMLDGKIIDFKNNESGFGLLSNDKIISKEKSGEEITYQVSEIKKMYTEKFDYMKTFFTVVWGVLFY